MYFEWLLIHPHNEYTTIFVEEEDIGTFTVKAVDDPRILNKTLYFRLPANTYSINEFVALWEEKIGKTMEKFYITKEELLKKNSR